MTELAKRIKKTRQTKGIDQVQMAEILGVRWDHYVYLEKLPETRMTLEQIQRITNALDVPLVDLLGIDPATITEVQAVGAESVLRFHKKTVALNIAIKALVAQGIKLHRVSGHEVIKRAREYEDYLNEES